MDNNGDWGSIFAGIVVGAVVTAIILGSFGLVPEYHAAIDACEAELPRNQKCVITAVPESALEEK